MNIDTKKTRSLFLLLTLFSMAHSLCETDDVNHAYLVLDLRASDDQQKPKNKWGIRNQDVNSVYSTHPRRAQSNYDFSSNVHFASMSSDDFRNQFRYASEDEILNDTNLELFAYQGFQKYAQTLSSYYDFILSLDARIKNDKSFYNKTKNMPGFKYSFFLWSEKSEFHNFITSEANRIKTEKKPLTDTQKQIALKHCLNLDDPKILYNLSDKYQKNYDVARNQSNQELMLRYKKRLLAIKATMQQNGCKHDYTPIVKKYPIFTDQDAHVFNHCYGSKLDQHLHEELCDAREKAMRLQARNFNSLHLQIITPAIYRLTAQAKTDCNPHSAFKLSDVAYALTSVLSDCLDIARKAGCAVSRGTISGVKTVLNPEHWKDMALGVINLGAFAFKEMVLQEGVDQAFFSLNTHEFNKQSKQHYQYNQAQMQALEKHINSTLYQLKKMPWDQLLEKGVELGVTITLDTLALQALGNFSSKASQAFVDSIADAISSPAAREYVVEIAGIGKIALEEGPEIAIKIINIAKKNETLLKQEGKTATQSINAIAKKIESPREKVRGIFEKNAKHIFRNKEGHLKVDSPQNRHLLMEIVRNEENYLGSTFLPTGHTKEWYSKITTEGKQLWAEVINGEIRNAGINDTPRIFNQKTGLTRSFKPKKD